ncbi:MAG: lytic transglycosylase domain-containing protein [Negativicutes bacterium]|nr:lytic transglycosylase domain-containing protein [Negativicutes bacterium]MBP8629368.1 lytic transglycosylase domain-containing protein [Negativicutes bacterium]MBP9537909.1 lytic transglycosylase domain-containing protein [Negativicutes bacterium]MBP9949461.1 lytic transglycosylase domain-containing protein [Negativicutes bacterium]
MIEAISGIAGVMKRISQIENMMSVNHSELRGLNFQKVLDNEQQKIKNTDSGINSNTKVDGDFSFENIINASAQKYGVDKNLIKAVANVESNFNPNAVSEAGAVGIMQLMPDTAKALGVANSYNPQENIDGGTKYLKELLNTFNGDVKKAVAAYNAGPQAVKAYNGVPPYKETENYVQKVLDIYK